MSADPITKAEAIQQTRALAERIRATAMPGPDTDDPVEPGRRDLINFAWGLDALVIGLERGDAKGAIVPERRSEAVAQFTNRMRENAGRH